MSGVPVATHRIPRRRWRRNDLELVADAAIDRLSVRLRLPIDVSRSLRVPLVGLLYRAERHGGDSWTGLGYGIVAYVANGGREYVVSMHALGDG